MAACSESRPAAAARAERAYRHAFGSAPEVIVRAPGRVNLIGEHTDYNEGFVLPMTIPLSVFVAAGRRGDGNVVVLATDYAEQDRFAADAPDSESVDGWRAYVRGVARAWRETGRGVPSCCLAIAADLPQRAGLSSSAALELGVAVAFQTLRGIAVRRRELARLCQLAENYYVGMRCGIMDQLVIALAEPGAALLIDTRSLEARPVPIPSGAAVLIVDSGSDRALAASGYNQRRAECEAAVAGARAAGFELSALRDLGTEDLPGLARRLEPTLLARVRHVVEENARVLAFASAMERGDLDEAGRLMVASHNSLRDLYNVSTPRLDAIVDAALQEPGILGARLTGAGFGGSVVALVATDRLKQARAGMLQRLEPIVGKPPRVWTAIPTGAADPLPLEPPQPVVSRRPDGRVLRRYSFAETS